MPRIILFSGLLVLTALFGQGTQAQAVSGAPALSPSDYVAIEQLYAHYAHYLDSGDGEKFAALFTTDGAFITNNPGFGVIRGKKDLAAFAVMAGSPPPAVKVEHFTGTEMIDPAPGGAVGSAYLVAGPDRFLYNDVFVKTAQGWRFKTREVHLSGCATDWPCKK